MMAKTSERRDDEAWRKNHLYVMQCPQCGYTTPDGCTVIQADDLLTLHKAQAHWADGGKMRVPKRLPNDR